MNPPFPQSEHSGLSANCLCFSPRRSHHLLPDFPQINSSHQIHLPGVNFQNLHSRIQGRVGELDFSIYTARTQKSHVQDINTVGSHDDLDGLSRFKPVELV